MDRRTSLAFLLGLALTLIPFISAGQTNPCPYLSRSLQYGSSGSDVVGLQTFFVQRGLLPAGATSGYFGPLTRAAVRQFQAGQGIVSSGSELNGYGVVGPRTRLAVAAQCGGSINSSGVQSPSTVSPVISLPQCPTIPVPPCANGTLISLGTNSNHCSLGYACQGGGPSCPSVGIPTCTKARPVSLGTDYYGCSLGYYCQPVVCPYFPTLTQCPAGQTLISGTDQYGCTNVSSCSGTPTAPTSTTPTPPPPTVFNSSVATGTAPLAVTFTGTAVGSYIVGYGDGSLGPNVSCDYASSCVHTLNLSHTYSMRGIYTAELIDNTGVRILTIIVN